MSIQARKLEKVFKGISNHRRIDVLFLINKYPYINLSGIAESLKCNYKTIAVHTKRLEQSGLISKHYEGKDICHNLTPYGKKVCKFLETFLDS